jgi:molybdenum cofactor synthesis domain-containing protein
MAYTPTAAVLLIGNELLSGRTRDLNLGHIGEELAKLGIPVRESRVVPDEPPMIIEAVNALRERYTYLFTTGGIGPTHDDITTNCIASAFNVPLYSHPYALQKLKEFYDNRGEKLNDARRKMAEVPKGAELIDNPITSAPGYKIDNVFVLAGIPKIMQAMFAATKPYLVRGQEIISKSITCNLAEGVMAKGLTDIQDEFPDIALGSYPSMLDSGFRVSLVVRGTDIARLSDAQDKIRALIISNKGKILEG